MFLLTSKYLYTCICLFKTSQDFFIDQKRFIPDLSYSVSQYLITCLLIAVRQEVNNFESFVVGHELDLAIKRALYCLLWTFGNQYIVGGLSWFS